MDVLIAFGNMYFLFSLLFISCLFSKLKRNILRDYMLILSLLCSRCFIRLNSSSVIASLSWVINCSSLQILVSNENFLTTDSSELSRPFPTNTYMFYHATHNNADLGLKKNHTYMFLYEEIIMSLNRNDRELIKTCAGNTKESDKLHVTQQNILWK